MLWRLLVLRGSRSLGSCVRLWRGRLSQSSCSACQGARRGPQVSALSARGRSQTMGAAGGLLPNTLGPRGAPGSRPCPRLGSVGSGWPALDSGAVSWRVWRGPSQGARARYVLLGSHSREPADRLRPRELAESVRPSRSLLPAPRRPAPGSAARVRGAVGRGAGERGAEQDSGISDADQGLGSRDAGVADADHDQPALYPRQSGIALFNLCQAISHKLLLPQF